MTNQKIYGPWIKWHGGECPVPPDATVEVKRRSGTVLRPYRALNYYWQHYNDGGDVVEYRIITEQPDLEAAEKLLRDNGYTVTKMLTFDDVTPITEIPPEGTAYWVISAAERDGVWSVQFANDAFDRLVIKRRVAYLEKEHALIAAQHIFGLKGGEL